LENTDEPIFCEPLEPLPEAAYPLPQATSVALGMIQNRALLAAARDVHTRLKEGQDLSLLLDRAKYFQGRSAAG